ncbi:hypothetical protein [Chryseobacterium sp. CCH4-E10]|uniref:hypothetical protein n=1 Tax=Chryseobacterium sp. CCH4-E10 TaxID=1768758 RepID=UPI00082AE484|nr:hypothetical protein [Chryseobacterium sp. CCH4-E10]
MEDKYSGMTVNERLYISGLIDQFYKAVEKKDKKLIISILKEIQLNDQSIEDILNSLKLNSDIADL